MKGFIRDLCTCPSLVRKLMQWKKETEPQRAPYGADPAQYFLDFVPPGPQREIVVVYLHGGGWDKGSPSFFSFIGQRLAQEGYRCVMPGYRLVPKSRFPAQIEDVTAGTKAALAHLEGQGVDARRAVVVGSSAGGAAGGPAVLHRRAGGAVFRVCRSGGRLPVRRGGPSVAKRTFQAAPERRRPPGGPALFPIG